MSRNIPELDSLPKQVADFIDSVSHGWGGDSYIQTACVKLYRWLRDQPTPSNNQREGEKVLAGQITTDSRRYIPAEDLLKIEKCSDNWNDEIRPHFYKAMCFGYLLAIGKLPAYHWTVLDPLPAPQPTETLSLSANQLYTTPGDLVLRDGTLPTEVNERIKKESAEYATAHCGGDANMQKAIFFGCLAAARREYLLSQKQALPVEELHGKCDQVIEDAVFWNRRCVELTNELSSLRTQLSEAQKDRDAWKEKFEKAIKA